MRTLRILLVIVAVAAVPIIATAQSSNYTFTLIANLADYGGYFEPASITNRGEVLFAPALLPPPAGPGGEGVLLWRSGVLTTIAAAGQPAPGGGIFGYTESPVQMNDHGDVAFIMTRDYLNLPPPTGFNAGVYRYNSRTGIVPVMLPGAPAPGGGSFWGSFFVVNINNRGDIYFPGMVCTTATVSFPTQACPDGSPGVLTYGAYKTDAKGRITSLVAPGDAAPGGSYFDFTHGPAANMRGDVAFTGHIFSDPCGNPGLLFCWDSVFLKGSPSGVIVPIARVGSSSPVSGRNYGPAFSPQLSPSGDLLFIADVSQASDGSELGVFLYTRGRTIVIAKPGDDLPGGGKFATTGFFNQNVAMNNAGDIVFNALLTDRTTQGIYLWRHGRLALVAKTGTDTGAGIIDNVDDFGIGAPSTQVAINDIGQILFAARFQSGGGAMLVATPR